MLVAALLDLGVPMHVLQEGLQRITLPGYHIETVGAVQSGIVCARYVLGGEGMSAQNSAHQAAMLTGVTAPTHNLTHVVPLDPMQVCGACGWYTATKGL